MRVFALLFAMFCMIAFFAFGGCTEPGEPEEPTDPPMIMGGWTGDRPVKEEDMAVFNEAMDGLTGVSYEPTMVATQVVAGLNYRFIATATGVYPGAEPYQVHIFIFKPLGSAPAELSDIVTL